MPTKLIEAGIDFIRLTSNQNGVIGQLHRASEELFMVEREAGHELKPGGMLGFYGHRSRHVFYGVRGDWCMLQITGYLCREQLSKYWRIRAHCTRIDIQQTFRVEQKVDEIIDQAEEDSCTQKPANGRHWDVRKVSVNRQSQTLYVGARQSEWFGRIYDKFQESKKEEYKNCIRYELEVKGDASRVLWDRYAAGVVSMVEMVRVVTHWYKKHGISLPEAQQWPDGEITIKREPSSAERSVAWLQTQVSGTFAKLQAQGYLFQAIQAVFHKLLTRVEMDSIIFLRYLDYSELY